MALPKTFTGGERLFAADLNDNFEALDSAIAVVQADVDTNEANLNASNLNSGTVATARMPAGSVLQVVYANTNTTVSSTSTTLISVGLSATITPSSASNKIWATYSLEVEGDSGTDDDNTIRAALVRGASEFVVSHISDTDNLGRERGTIVGSYLDSPATTSAITYEVKAAQGSAADSRNWKAQPLGYSSLTLFEIAG